MSLLVACRLVRRIPATATRVGLTTKLSLLALVTALPHSVLAQAPAPAKQPTHLTIPYLGNTAPGDIEFAAAECDLTASGAEMHCHFRQVFITRASFDQTACVITSNGYDQLFRRESATTWVGWTSPDGECGVVDEARLDDGGGTRWTLTLTSKATRALDRNECRSVSATAPVAYSWRDIKRPLTCATIQPGSIER
ncbi:MAG: hypothetical protein U0Q11_11140 [Vicinamibacterales bacterium]